MMAGMYVSRIICMAGDMTFKSIDSAPTNKPILLGFRNGDIEIGCCRLGELTKEWQFFVSKGISGRQPIAWCEYPLFDPNLFCKNISISNEWIEFTGEQDQIEDIKHAKNGIKTKNKKNEISEVLHFPKSTLNCILKAEFKCHSVTHYMIVE